MPAEALPYEPAKALAGTVHYRREYRDILGRAMKGTATITGTARFSTDELAIPVAPVTVDIDAGVLEVDLPPDTYTVAAALRTVDGARVTDMDTVTLS